MIHVRNVSKSFGDKKVLDNVSFEVSHGSITGLIGHNGAGKTTLMGILTGLISPEDGSVSVGGIDLFKDLGRARDMIGYVPQKTSLYQELSGFENLSYFGSMLGLKGEVLQNSIAEVSAMTALDEHLDKKVIYYSGGMQKRLNLAIGLLGNPKILYLDEPTVGVDPQTRDIILEALVRLSKEKGISILYTSHYLQEVSTICERLVVLEHGKIIAYDTLENLLKHSSLEHYMKVHN